MAITALELSLSMPQYIRLLSDMGKHYS